METGQQYLNRLIQGIGEPDETARAEAYRQWDSIAKPLGSLGLLEEEVAALAALKGSADVRIRKPCLLVFCADNGVVGRGVTQCGSSVTAKVAEALAEKRSSVSPMAEAAGCCVLPVDIGIKDFAGHPGVLERRIRNGTEDICNGPAMTREECLAAIAAGADLAFEQIRSGADLLLIGEMGIGNTTTAAAVAATMLQLPADAVTGRGAGLSEEGLRRKRKAVEEALTRNRPNPNDPVDVLTKVGGLDLAGMCGAFLGAAACRTGAVVDGMISAAAALCAVSLCPSSKNALFASHVSAEPVGAAILEKLGLKATIHAELRLGEGSGAVMLLPLLQMGLRVYHSGQGFERLGIKAYVPQN